MNRITRSRLAPLLAAVFGLAAAGHGTAYDAAPQYANPGYDARFVFSRVRYGANGGFGFRRGGSSWAHDYPRADEHIPRILEFLTNVDANTDGTNVFDLDDPAIFRSPMLYISEPGFWTMSDAEADGLRRYIAKGGFLIFDDFEVGQIENMIFQMNRVLPGFELIELTPEHEIFDSFFKVENIYFPHPLVPVTPVYYGIFEDNDPDRRMIAIVNHNNDLAEYWEWSETGYFPVDITNEAYKIGINYIIYTLTH